MQMQDTNLVQRHLLLIICITEREQLRHVLGCSSHLTYTALDGCFGMMGDADHGGDDVDAGIGGWFVSGNEMWEEALASGTCGRR